MGNGVLVRVIHSGWGSGWLVNGLWMISMNLKTMKPLYRVKYKRLCGSLHSKCWVIENLYKSPYKACVSQTGINELSDLTLISLSQVREALNRNQAGLESVRLLQL